MRQVPGAPDSPGPPAAPPELYAASTNERGVLGDATPDRSEQHAGTGESAQQEEDRWLVQAAADRDTGAFEQLVRRHTPALYAGALRTTGSPELAEDVVQEVWLSAWLHLPGFRAQSSLRTWLVRIVTRVALNALRRPHATVPLDRAGEQPDPVDTEQRAELAERQRAVRAAIAGLPARQRDAVVLRDLEGLSYEQVAGELDCSVSSVKSSLHRGRAALAQALQAHRPDRAARETAAPVPAGDIADEHRPAWSHTGATDE